MPNVKLQTLFVVCVFKMLCWMPHLVCFFHPLTISFCCTEWQKSSLPGQMWVCWFAWKLKTMSKSAAFICPGNVAPRHRARLQMQRSRDRNPRDTEIVRCWKILRFVKMSSRLWSIAMDSLLKMKNATVGFLFPSGCSQRLLFLNCFSKKKLANQQARPSSWICLMQLVVLFLGFYSFFYFCLRKLQTFRFSLKSTFLTNFVCFVRFTEASLFYIFGQAALMLACSHWSRPVAKKKK